MLSLHMSNSEILVPTPPRQIDFARLCKEVRLKFGYTQAEMARFCAIATRTWIYYENGEREPSGHIGVWLVEMHKTLFGEGQ